MPGNISSCDHFCCFLLRLTPGIPTLHVFMKLVALLSVRVVPLGDDGLLSCGKFSRDFFLDFYTQVVIRPRTPLAFTKLNVPSSYALKTQPSSAKMFSGQKGISEWACHFHVGYAIGLNFFLGPIKFMSNYGFEFILGVLTSKEVSPRMVTLFHVTRICSH